MSVTLGLSLRFLRSMFALHPRRQLKEMYAFILIFSFAASLITVFEPVFFFKQGFALWQIALYYAIHYILYVILIPCGGMFAARFGYERSLTASTPIFVIYFLTLASLPTIPNLFWAAPVVLTVFKILYWPAYHATFASYTDGHNRGTEQSLISLVDYSAGVLGPILGGILAMVYGFPALFIVAAAIVSLAGIPLLRTKERYHIRTFSYTSAWRIVLSRQHRRLFIAMAGWGENLIHLVLWPIFVFSVVGSVEALGFIAALSAAVMAGWGFVVGEITDRFTPRRTLKIFVPLSMLGYVFRSLAQLPLAAVGADVWARTTQISVSIPFLSQLYTNAKRVDPLQYSVAFEMSLALFKAITAVVLVVLFLTVSAPTGFVAAFALAAALSLFYLAL